MARRGARRGGRPLIRSDDWAALEAAFATLVDLSPEARAERLAQVTSADPELGARLATLLAADADADRRLRRYDLLSTAPDASAPPPGDPPLADPLGISGRSVAHFRVLDVLGSGGMGVAYRAEDTRLGRTVALKFLLPQYALDAEARRRFVQEARAASALEHPNVCTVLEVGESEHGLFFAMPAYAGETLRQRLARTTALAVADAVDIARQILLGLGAAHAAGITHRDLKPGNVVITPDGTVKILDFGLAKVRDLHQSTPGVRPGTVAYMSPEQLQGRDVDHRSDLWSTGVVIYEMLTGARPFGAGHDLSTLYSILHDEPAPPSSLAAVPPRLDAVVAGLLRKRPDERFASAADALAALADIDAAATPARATHPPLRRWVTGSAPHGLPRRRVRRSMHARAATLLGTLLVLVVAALAVPALRRSAADRAAAAGERASVAVMPFADTSPARDQAHLGEGVAEEILNALTQVNGLRVPARSSSFAFKGTDAPLSEIARQLDVRTVLEGSVHRDGNRIRITVRLVDARGNRHLWSQTFDRRISDIFAVQAEIAGTVAEALRVRLAPPATAQPPTRNLVAYELYLRGLFHWNRRTSQDLGQAIDFFTQATQHDSTYAQAYAGLALAYAVLQPMHPSTPDTLERGHAAATRALALDPTLAEAHAARGYAFHWQWRWSDAERELQRAIALNPAYATAYEWYGEHLVKMGRTDEGEELVRRAIVLDPLSLVAQSDLGIVLMLSRRYDEAIAQLERVHRADPGFPIALYVLHRTHLLAGDTAAAAEAGRRWAELVGMSEPADMVILTHAVHDAGQRTAALAVLERWQASPAPVWLDIAMYYAMMDERDRAIDAIERAMELRLPMMAQLNVTPWLDPLRDDPRMADILRRMAFPPNDDAGA